MFLKIEGALGSFGSPKWVTYYCSDFCMRKDGFGRGDADFLHAEDVTPKMACQHCEQLLKNVREAFYRCYPADRPAEICQ